MKISEAITQLQSVLDNEGDIEISYKFVAWNNPKIDHCNNKITQTLYSNNGYDETIYNEENIVYQEIRLDED